uniref:F-box domain-containing protein n=1 Tax=Mola mola TaxID=94237 RepID=A0A3Q4AS70_MOLML
MVRTARRHVCKYTVTRKSKHCKQSHQRGPQARTIVTRSQCETSGSMFHQLPSEVFHMILGQLSVLDMSVFSMVSKEIAKHIVDYISTLSWRNRMIVESFHPSTRVERRSTIEEYFNLSLCFCVSGLLFKRCTLLLPTKDRLKFIFGMFSQVRKGEKDCIGFSSYGAFLRTLIAGWDERECYRVFNFLCDTTNLLQKVEAVIRERWYQELQVRLFCRQVLLDQWPNHSDCQFWLTLLLRPWPIASQAHLLLILYGPQLPDGTLGWQDLVETEIPQSSLWDLARVFLVFSKPEVKDQTSDSMLSILEELIVIPQQWHVENMARLLVLCGSSLCYNMLASKAINGRLPEISKVIVLLLLLQVCEKDGYHMSWAVKLVQELCNVFGTAVEKYRFIQQLEEMFSEVIREVFEFSVADRETLHSLCVLLDSSARFHTKFLHMFLK